MLLKIIAIVIGIIITIVVGEKGGTPHGMEDAAQFSLMALGRSLQTYKKHILKFPTTDQGLDALLANPSNHAKWKGPYTKSWRLNDPWGNSLAYMSDGGKYTITSAGADGKIGTGDDLVYDNPKQ